jgi:predicted lipid-binding transport protein (Tim44 family)
MVASMRRAALVVLLAALLAGCNSEASEPAPLPKVSASGTAEASPSPSPTAAVPPAAQAATPQGASAFARFFYAEVQRAFAEKDPEIIGRLSAPGCKTCDLFVASLTRLRDEEESASPVIYDVLYAETPGFSGPEAVVEVRYNSPANVRKDKSGAVISTEPEVRDVQEQMVLTRAADGWLVKELLAV